MNIYNAISNIPSKAKKTAVTAAAGLALLVNSGCRASYDDMTVTNPQAQVAYDHVKKDVLQDTLEVFIQNWQKAFESDGKIDETKLVPSVHTTENLSDVEVEALGKYRTLAQNSGTLARTSYLTTAEAFVKLYGMRDSLANWTNMSEEQRKDAEENFELSLANTKYASQIKEAKSAYVAVNSAVTEEERLVQSRLIRNIRTKLNHGAYNGNTETELKALFKQGDENIKSYESWLLVSTALNVREGQWGNELSAMIDMYNNLEVIRGAQQPKELAQTLYDLKDKNGATRTYKIDGEQVTLQQAVDNAVKAAKTHYAHQDDEFQDDIFQDNRYPVANTYARLLTDGQGIGTLEHIAAINALDSQLCLAAQTKEDKLFKYLDMVAEVLPTGLDLVKIGKDVPYLFVPNSPDGDVKEVLDTVLKSWAGFDDANERVGDESPLQHILLRSLFAAMKYGSIAVSAASAFGGHGHGSNGNGGGSSDPSPKKGISGSETGGNGIK